MKTLTQEWLNAACDEVLTIEALIAIEPLTHVVAFHAQQAVEKCLKAILEEYAVEFPKTHDLGRLYRLLPASCHVHIEQQNLLQTLNTLYIDSRYPGDFGLLPGGKPSLEDAEAFYQFTQEIHTKVSEMLSQIPTESE